MTTTNSNSGARTDKVAIHNKVTRLESAAKTAKSSTVDQQILQAIVGQSTELLVRAALVKIALKEAKAAGVCFVEKTESDLWVPSKKTPSAGRLPDTDKFTAELTEKCDDFEKSFSVQTLKLEFMNGLMGFFMPIQPKPNERQLMMLIAPASCDVILATTVLQKVASSFQLWLNGQTAKDANWQVDSLSSIIELVSRIENQKNSKRAAEETANCLADRLGCSSVAVGLLNKRNRMKLRAISGVAKIDKSSDSTRNYLQSLVDSVTRQSPGLFPAVDEDNNFLLQSHRQLASTIQAESVFSHPIVTEDEEVVGAIVYAGPKDTLSSSQFDRFTMASAPGIANAIRVVSKLKTGVIARTKNWMVEKISSLTRLILFALLVGTVLLMFLPVTYRVRCNCVTEPVSRRFAVAPFDGQILSGLVEPGDVVTKDQVLAEMDGRSIRLELAAVTAERQQSLRTREMELAERNVPKTILAELEYDRLVSEEGILEYKRDHLLVKSPIDGVVLSGSLERAEAASVETGQVLFEIGPTKPVKIEVAIPGNEIAQVKVGFPAKIWIDGQEDDPIEGEIKSIHPRSETRDAKNVFVAEIEFENEDDRLRPGMKGHVRIDCEQRSLGWSLFHKPVNFVRSRLTWW